MAGLLLRINFLNRCIAVQGIGITVGWYAAIFKDIYDNSRGFHILYANTPSSMKAVMFDNDTSSVLNTTPSNYMKIAAHAMDTCGHPGLTILFLWICLRNGGRWKDIFKLPVLVAVFCLSRFWSVVHNDHNFGRFGIYYVGYDVYNLDTLDVWYNAYVAEGVFFAVAFVWGVYDLYSGLTRRQKQQKSA